MRRTWPLLALICLLGCNDSTGLPQPEVWYPKNVDPKYLPGSDHDFIQKEAAGPADPVVYAFALWGCNRIDWGDVSKVDWTSTANQPWLAQVMVDVEALPSLDPTLEGIPPHLFFTGDLVLNETDDQAKTLNSQMTAWSSFFKSQPIIQNERIMPFLMLGNHEALISTEVQPKVYKEFLPATDVNLTTWLSILRANKFFVPPPTDVKGIHRSAASALDEVTSPQEAFTSYSFDMGDIHFVVLNTDTLTSHVTDEAKSIGWLQVDWLEKDLDEASKTADLIFVFGHKPAVEFPGSGQEVQKGDLHVNDAIQQRFIDALNKHDKVVGYFAAHAHAWGVQTLTSAGVAKKTTQLIAGNGGSILQDSWQPGGGPYFGATVVKVHRSGMVTATAYGRPAPNPIYTPPIGDMVKREELQVYP